ncbi:MAG TPA: arsenate reductase ArsC [Candidatus Omnitrophota bacterium]|nr:arsenate reductase ArsC [Candidatus Omnitrophota bacterium]
MPACEKIKILFVCVENSCRSQVAEGLARHFFGDTFEPYSAGSRPLGKINPYAIMVMEELGIDIALQQSKGFDAVKKEKFNYVVTLGCGDICPFVPAEKHVHWNIPDPQGKPLDFFRFVRDDIKIKIEALLCQYLWTVRND